MAYDERLGERMRDLLERADLTERKRSGGLAFLLGVHSPSRPAGRVARWSGSTRVLSTRWSPATPARSR
jgi:hypothetical protein